MRDTNLVSGAPLYAHPGQVEKQLAAVGRHRGEPLTPERIFPFDHLHNHRIEAMHRAVDTLGLGPASKVLEIGSGFGGQARYLADRTACHVTALELQETMHETARCLTKRCGLAERITHLCGDALIHPLPCDSFDAVVSLCAILHTADRPRLCTRLACALHAGGKCYIEDCYLHAPLRGRAIREMQRYISGPSLSSSRRLCPGSAGSGVRRYCRNGSVRRLGRLRRQDACRLMRQTRPVTCEYSSSQRTTRSTPCTQQLYDFIGPEISAASACSRVVLRCLMERATPASIPRAPADAAPPIAGEGSRRSPARPRHSDRRSPHSRA